MGRALWLTLVLGCGAASPPASVVLPAPPDACGAAHGLVLEVPENIPATWEHGISFGGHAQVVARWCGEGAVVVTTMHVAYERGGSADYAFDPDVARLDHGASLSRDVEGPAVPQSIVIDIAAMAGERTITATATTRSTESPTFVAERDACVADDGTFAPMGLSHQYACDRPTHDAGRRCLSSADCEGACIDAAVEVTTTPPDGRTCAPGEEVRLHVGTCDTHTIRFGCAPRLSSVLTECAIPGQVGRVHTVCVD